MSKRNWLPITFIGGIVLIAGMIVLAIVTEPDLPSAQGGDEVAEHQHSQKSYTVTYESGAGLKLTIDEGSPADANHEESPTDTKDALKPPLSITESDLLAQERMAHWTRWLGIMTGVGLVLLAATLVEALGATEAASVAADAADKTLQAERAWLTHQGVEYGLNSNGGERDGKTFKRGMPFQPHFVNTGRSPATDCMAFVAWELVPYKSSEIPYFEIPKQDDRHASGVIGPSQRGSGMQQIIVDDEYDKFFTRQSKLIIHIRVDYRDVFERERDHIYEATLEGEYVGDKIDPDRGPYPIIKFLPIGPQNRST